MTTTLEPTVTEVDPFAHREYVDPHPGQDGEALVKFTCGKCSGNGVVNYGNVSFAKGTQHGNVEARWCFDCHGVGFISRKVKNIRISEKRAVKAHNEAMDKAREYVANAAVREAEEIARLEAYRSEHADVAAALDIVGGDFAASLTETIKTSGGLSERQSTTILEAAQREAAKAVQAHIGTEGQPVTFEARVEDVKVFDGYHGVSYLFLLRTTGGDKVSVFTSAQFMFDLRDSGETALLTATVKEHKEYQGAKETQVARIKKAKA